jgi:hypothetical protein
MKYILMMSAPKAGFDTYRAWSKQDMQAHLAVLNGINTARAPSGTTGRRQARQGTSRSATTFSRRPHDSRANCN